MLIVSGGGSASFVNHSFNIPWSPSWSITFATAEPSSAVAVAVHHVVHGIKGVLGASRQLSVLLAHSYIPRYCTENNASLGWRGVDE